MEASTFNPQRRVHCTEALFALAASSVLFIQCEASVQCHRPPSPPSSPPLNSSPSPALDSNSSAAAAAAAAAASSIPSPASSSSSPSDSLTTTTTRAATSQTTAGSSPLSATSSQTSTASSSSSPSANSSNSSSVQSLNPATKTRPSLIQFLRQIYIKAAVTDLALVIALIYVDRLRKVLSKMARGDPDTPYKIFLSAILAASKFLGDDCAGLNKTLAQASQGLYTLQEINVMERSFLGLLKFSLFVTSEDLTTYIQSHKELDGLRLDFIPSPPASPLLLPMPA